MLAALTYPDPPDYRHLHGSPVCLPPPPPPALPVVPPHCPPPLVLSAPAVRSLSWLLVQFELDPDRFPGSATLQRVVAKLAAGQQGDDDACAPLGSLHRSVRCAGRRRVLAPLLYELCTPETPGIPVTRMRRLCQCLDECGNPRHWLPLSLLRMRERAAQRNQYGNTRLTEAILRAHYPGDLARRPALGTRVVYRRLHVFARLSPTAFAHIAPVRRKSALVGIYRSPPPPPPLPAPTATPHIEDER